MVQLTPSVLRTPAGHGIPVNVISSKHPVKQGKRIMNVPLLDESGIRVVAACAKEAIDHKKDCMIEWTGWRGVGKSTGILWTALAIDPKIDIDKIAFWTHDITRLFATNPRGHGPTKTEPGLYPQIISDETGYALHGKQWQTRAQIEISKNMIINRIMAQIFHMAAPDKMQINNEIRNMAFMWIHVSEPDWYKQGYAVVRFAPPQKQSEFYSTKYWEPKFAFIYPELTGELWDRYEAKKFEFVREASLLTASGKNLAPEKHSEARDTLIREYYSYRKERGDPISCRDLAGKIALSKTQISTILNESSTS